MTALVGSTVGFQPLRVPSSVLNRKAAGAVVPPFETRNEGMGFPSVMLNTSPVGMPVAVLPGTGAGGMVTTKGEPTGNLWPARLWGGALPVTWSLTQKGLPLERVRPQPLTKCGSATVPPKPKSVTRSVRVYCANVKTGRRKSERANAARTFENFIVNCIVEFLQSEIFAAKHVPRARKRDSTWQDS